MHLFINRGMKLLDLLENGHADPPLKGVTTDDLMMAVRHALALKERVKQLPGADLTQPLQDQLHALSRSYQAELSARKKAAVR